MVSFLKTIDSGKRTGQNDLQSVLNIDNSSTCPLFHSLLIWDMKRQWMFDDSINDIISQHDTYATLQEKNEEAFTLWSSLWHGGERGGSEFGKRDDSKSGCKAMSRENMQKLLKMG